jgi:hypothetical protein
MFFLNVRGSIWCPDAIYLQILLCQWAPYGYSWLKVDGGVSTRRKLTPPNSIGLQLPSR